MLLFRVLTAIHWKIDLFFLKYANLIETYIRLRGRKSEREMKWIVYDFTVCCVWCNENGYGAEQFKCSPNVIVCLHLVGGHDQHTFYSMQYGSFEIDFILSCAHLFWLDSQFFSVHFSPLYLWVYLSQSNLVPFFFFSFLNFSSALCGDDELKCTKWN